MAVSSHEEMKARTDQLDRAFYALLDACDNYRTTAAELLAAEKAAEEPRQQLVHRLQQLSGRADELVRVLEDDGLTILLPMLDRLFVIERAERGADI